MLRFPPLVRRVAILSVLFIMAALPSLCQQKGKASYYSRRANGARTSSGTRLNNDSLVCAHRTHPFGTLLRVRNTANGKEVIVKVIDRGPHARGRVIDISYEAARRLGILAAGVALVEVSVYDDTKVPFKAKEHSMPELDIDLVSPADEMNSRLEWQREHRRADSKHTKEHKENKHNAAAAEGGSHTEKATAKETEANKKTHSKPPHSMQQKHTATAP